MATPSVISRVRRLGSTLKLPSARATISSSEWSSMLRGETLSDTPTSIPSSSHLHSSGRQGDLRLVVQHQLALWDGASQLSREPRAAKRLCLLLGLVDRVAA